MIKKTLNYDRTNEPPVKEGQELSLNIETLGNRGDGISKIKGYTIFVKNTVVGEMVNVRVTKVFNSYAFAEVIEEEQNG